MKNTQVFVLILVFTLAMSPIIAAAQTNNKQLGIQGRLTKPGTSEPLQGEFAATFTIFDASAGGNSLWSETQTIRTDSKGVFQTKLGSTNALGLSFDKDYWVEVKVGTETLTPRIALTGAPYSQSLLGNLDGSKIVGLLTQSVIPALMSSWTGTIDASRLVGTISGALLTAGSIDNTKINFNYAASNTKGGAATDLACSGCVQDSEITGIDASKITNANFMTALSGGKKAASGTASAKDGDKINYGYTFSANPVIVCTVEHASEGRICTIKSKGTSSFTINLHKAGGGTDGTARTIHWIAIGS